VPNNFSADADCVALYRFESGELTTDSKATNTLTDVNTVVADTARYREGAASADFELDNSEYFYRTDANLSSNFPLKSGTTNKTVSLSLWVRLENFAGDGDGLTIIGKYEFNSGGRSLNTSIANAGGVNNARLTLGFNSGLSREHILHASDLSADTWYHITYTYTNADKSYAIRIRDASGNVVGTDKTGTATLDANGISVTTANLQIGAFTVSGVPYEHFDGLMDELVIFNRAITADEATAIALGQYPPTVSKTVTDAGAGADAINQVLVSLAIAEAGYGSDAMAGMAAAVPVAETGHGADLISQLRAALALAEAARGTDSIAQILAHLSPQETGHGADAVSNIAAALSVPDSGYGAEQPAIAVTLAIQDAGSGTEALSLLSALLKTVADAAAGTDAIGGISVTVPVADTGYGTDLMAAIAVIASVLDSAHGTDATVVIVHGAPTKVIVTFTGKKPGVTFTGKKPGIDFDT
jgi:hypothetical protein